MKRLPSLSIVLLFASLFLFFGGELSAQGGPKGAKAIFDSGEGPAVRMSSGSGPVKQTTQASAPSKEKYVGISYKLVLLREDGRFDIVSRSRTFRSGERLKLLVRTNKPGYLTIINIGTSGNTNVLCNEQVEPSTLVEIPRTGNFRFAGDPGTEKLLIMLSGSPNPLGAPGQGQTVAQGPVQTPPPPSGDPAAPPPPPGGQGDLANLPPPPPATMTASLGAKDIMLEDANKTSYGVISPKNNWKPEAKGKKDIILESQGGENFGVVPASYIEDGKILTLEIKLKHR